MSKHRVMFLTVLLCLTLTVSSGFAQDFKVIDPNEQPGRILRLYQDGMPSDVDLEAYLQTGEVKLKSGLSCIPPKVTPGPAPDPYPHVHMWEQGIEQLGPTSVECDGIWFINGNIWHPKKWALVMWRVKIPDPKERLATEFENDITLSLWVDWNQDKMWGQNELMIRENLNIHKFFPFLYSCLEIWYLTWFRIPRATSFSEECSQGITKFTAKLWTRGMVSYDDADVSPDEECLFGEVEDYQISYFEIIHKRGRIGGGD
ncbi:MAG: hypothetical protein JSV33_13980 [bacterium]|nr:MAG: hypothetical protein JSV33_13980 [bacterium]